MEKTKQILKSVPQLLQRYQATMVLAAVGDSMGYKNGSWQFTHEGAAIHKQMMQLTKNEGVSKLRIQPINFRYSDDTVMHFATALALIESLPDEDQRSICLKLARRYRECWKYMSGRAPGNTCKKGIVRLNNDCSNWIQNPFSQNAGGCGGAMRSACIGLYFPHAKDILKLIAISIESGRITHHNPIGYLGSMIAAYFTSLAIRNIPPNQWLSLLMTQAFPLSVDYIRKSNISVNDNLNRGDWARCYEKWKKYAAKRNMSIVQPSEPQFPKQYGVQAREQFYYYISNGAWPGGLGIDSVIIAYDALLGCKGDWGQLCLRGMLHGGDNDSTGTIAGAWFGALYGYKGVSKQNMEEVEGKEQAIQYGRAIFEIVYKKGLKTAL